MLYNFKKIVRPKDFIENNKILKNSGFPIGLKLVFREDFYKFVNNNRIRMEFQNKIYKSIS